MVLPEVILTNLFYSTSIFFIYLSLHGVFSLYKSHTTATCIIILWKKDANCGGWKLVKESKKNQESCDNISQNILMCLLWTAKTFPVCEN